MTQPARRTIDDFGEQWTHFTANEGYYGSPELFADLISPLASPADFAGKAVADIGSGTGRIVRMLASARARRIVAVEPSAAMAVLRDNTKDLPPGLVDYQQVTGDALPASGDLDWVVSFGVLHHIPEPAPVVRAAFRALRSGGRMLVWLYGREGNELYLRVASPLRRITTRLPHWALSRVSSALQPALAGYAALCQSWSLPMRSYMRDHIARLSPEAQSLTIYDQLNPQYAKYYARTEAEALLRDGGFVDIELHHRHGYSWTVCGRKP
jgi:SAM-dependent methyltransferase